MGGIVRHIGRAALHRAHIARYIARRHIQRAQHAGRRSGKVHAPAALSLRKKIHGKVFLCGLARGVYIIHSGLLYIGFHLARQRFGPCPGPDARLRGQRQQGTARFFRQGRIHLTHRGGIGLLFRLQRHRRAAARLCHKGHLRLFAGKARVNIALKFRLLQARRVHGQVAKAGAVPHRAQLHGVARRAARKARSVGEGRGRLAARHAKHTPGLPALAGVCACAGPAQVEKAIHIAFHL